jgi:hypothetical protein
MSLLTGMVVVEQVVVAVLFLVQPHHHAGIRPPSRLSAGKEIFIIIIGTVVDCITNKPVSFFNLDVVKLVFYIPLTLYPRRGSDGMVCHSSETPTFY